MKQLTPARCPSWSFPTMAGIKDLRVLAVVAGTPDEPEVVYLNETEPITPERATAEAAPFMPSEVYRFTIECRREACSMWVQNQCGMASCVLEKPAVTATLPKCPKGFRSSCQWFRQSGREICFRCPAVVSDRVVGTPQPEERVEYV